MATNIATSIKTNDMSNEFFGKLYPLVHTLVNDYPVTYVDIKPAQANKYIGDMYGLFKNDLNVPENAIILHILANGYNSSCDYHGEKLRLMLLDYNIITTYLQLMKK